MSEPSPDQASPPSGFGQTPPADPVPVLAVVAAICLVCSAVVLPWVRWGFSYQDYGDIGTNVSLWDIVSNGAAGDFGADWMLLVAAGMAAAVVGSLAELIRRPVSPAARWLAVAGFGGVVGASCVGLVVGVNAFAGSSSVLFTGNLTSTLALGFWVALVIAVVGTIASLVRLTAPPNPARRPEPFAPSPWGPPPGILPPGYYPPGIDWSEYVARGQVPPGYVPPSYRPAVYPRPGFVTPAYTMPGHPAQGWGPPFDQVPGDSTMASSEPGAPTPGAPTPGHLVVVEAGRTTVLTVEPGKRLLVGRDPDAEIRVSDRRVSERHATIERRGDGWAVQDVDALNPTRLIDAWGTNRQVRGETTITAGQLLLGDVLITLYANQP
ncbi:MAG: FHA domain-containing protein [Candidatus Limnocylindrales bacterium]|jgi:hypothetical protein